MEQSFGRLPVTPPRLALNTVTNFTDNDKQWAAAATVVDSVRVEMYYPLSQLNERVTDLTRQAMLLIVVAIIGGTLVAWGAGHVVSLPLRHLAHAVRERTSESVRVPEDSGVDEVNQLGHAINALAERLEATLNSARSFSQNAAHELRTPLTSMRTDLDVLNTHFFLKRRARACSAISSCNTSGCYLRSTHYRTWPEASHRQSQKWSLLILLKLPKKLSKQLAFCTSRQRLN